MEIGERLKKARKSKGYTQESLASAIGVSRGVITNIEYGKAEPQPLVVRAICNTLGVHEQWLTSGEGAADFADKAEKSTRILSEICSLAAELTEDEQTYILETIRVF